MIEARRAWSGVARLVFGGLKAFSAKYRDGNATTSDFRQTKVLHRIDSSRR